MGVAGRVFPQHHQLVGLVEGKRAEQRGIHHAEDGGVGADAQRQNHGGEGGESRCAAEHPDGVAEVLHGRSTLGGGRG